MFRALELARVVELQELTCLTRGTVLETKIYACLATQITVIAVGLIILDVTIHAIWADVVAVAVVPMITLETFHTFVELLRFTDLAERLTWNASA